MPLIAQFWNGRLLGLPSAVIAMGQSIYFSIRDRISTWLWSCNINRFGTRSRIQFGVVIRNPRNVNIGSDAIIGRGVVIAGELATGILKIGNRSQISSGCILDISGNLTIGENVVLSSGCAVYTHSHGLDPRSIPIANGLTIDDGVWIGTRVLILPSVRRIGKSAIVGAGSVVTKDVEDYCILAGNPAKVIGQVNSREPDHP